MEFLTWICRIIFIIGYYVIVGIYELLKFLLWGLLYITILIIERITGREIDDVL